MKILYSAFLSNRSVWSIGRDHINRELGPCITDAFHTGTCQPSRKRLICGTNRISKIHKERTKAETGHHTISKFLSLIAQ
ncbi:unnamed protein product [Dicrocoelium dendriticum]|nr:unnamed protein product [Dicrocoelium dendriticum]